MTIGNVTEALIEKCFEKQLKEPKRADTPGRLYGDQYYCLKRRFLAARIISPRRAIDQIITASGGYGVGIFYVTKSKWK